VRIGGNLSELEAVNQHLIDVFSAGKGTQNIDRLVRLPYTVNVLSAAKIRRGRKPAATYIVEYQPGRGCTLDELRTLTTPPAHGAREHDPRVHNRVEPHAHSGASTKPTKFDRSRDLLAKVARAKRAGWSDEQIHAKFDSHPHAIEQANPVRAVARCIAQVETDGPEWDAPQPLDDALPAVDALDPTLLPDTLRPWVLDNASRMQCPIEYVAVSAMVTLGACLGRKIAVRPKRLDSWFEFPNQWGMCVGPPSWMKSPAMEEPMGALRTIENNLLAKHEEAHLAWEQANEAARVKRTGAKHRAEQAARKGKEFDAAELVRQPGDPEPQPRRLIVIDANVPSMVEVLLSSPNGVLVHRDELAALIAEMDAAGMEGARGFYLAGYSGKEPYTQDRITRGLHRHVPHVCLSLLGGIQPARIAPLLRESLATGGGDGFMSRFSLTVWPDNPGAYRRIDRAPDAQARKAVFGVYDRLHALTARDVEAMMGDSPTPFLRLKPTAAEAFGEWHVALVNRTRSGVEDAALSAHLGKYPKTVAGLALLIHLADGGTGDIPFPAVQRALKWAKFLESHARRIYSSVGQAHIEAARSLLKHLRKGDLASPFKVREIYRRGWASLLDVESAQGAVDVLEAKNYIQARHIDSGPAGGRPSAEYVINPKALQMK
jgi:putative DNA primase/helicase